MTLTPDYTIAGNGLPSILNRPQQHTQSTYKGDRLNNHNNNNNHAMSNAESQRCWNVEQSTKLLPKRGATNNMHTASTTAAAARLINNHTNSHRTIAGSSNMVFNYNNHQSDRCAQSGPPKSVAQTHESEAHRNSRHVFWPQALVNNGGRGGLDKSEKERLNNLRKNKC